MKNIIGIIFIVSMLFIMSGCSEPKEIRFKDGSVRTVASYGFIEERHTDFATGTASNTVVLGL